jgi:hypothetical protein
MLASLICWVSPTLHGQRPFKVAPPIDKTGWWVRVNVGATKAKQVNFGVAEKPKPEADSFRAWTPGAPRELELPREFQKSQTLTLTVKTLPPEGSAEFCVFYQSQGIALVEFTGDHKRQLNSKTKEPKCLP